MNFDMAAELAVTEGIDVEQVVVKDDVAIEDSIFTTGRRGIAGTIFIHKITGALAEQGATLQEVKRIGEKAANAVRSMGVALSSCSIPAAGEPTFTLSDSEMEVGIGIHGEPGIECMEVASAQKIARQLVEPILADLQLGKGAEVALMINGMGATPQMELYIVMKEVHSLLEKREVLIYQSFVGEYMTSLEMGGVSITIFALDEELKHLLNEESDAPYFRV